MVVGRGKVNPLEPLDPSLLEAADNVGVMLPDGGRAETIEILEVDGIFKDRFAPGRKERVESTEPFLLGAADKAGVVLPDGGRDEKLGILVLPFGGCGENAMLMGLRSVLPVGLGSLVAATDTDLNVGIFDVELAC